MTVHARQTSKGKGRGPLSGRLPAALPQPPTTLPDPPRSDSRDPFPRSSFPNRSCPAPSSVMTLEQTPKVSEFPSMKAARLLRILMSEPLNYRILRINGSHKRLEAKNYPPLSFSWHAGKELAPSEVRKLLLKSVKLSQAEALELLK